MLLEMLVDIPFELTRSDSECSLLLITFGQRSRVFNGSSSECVFNEVVPLRQGELEVHLEQTPCYHFLP